VITRSKSTDEGEIDRIYRAYPLKKGPASARKAIEKAIKRLRDAGSPDPASFLVGKIHEWKSGRDRDQAAGRFVPNYPYPATWFNDERYNDEDGAPCSPTTPQIRYVNPEHAYSGSEYLDSVRSPLATNTSTSEAA
jgi:hypothetical protein